MTVALEVSNLSVSFGGRLALAQVDLTAEAGAITGLIGPNGAGKTTLFNVVCGLLPPSSGRVRVDGTDVTRLAPYKRARKGLARTFQRLEPFGLLTVRENVRLAAGVAHRNDPDAVADELLDRLGVSDLAPQRADRLPTGQARLVELARALATRPKVLLLDEPASGQDERETAAFSAVLRGVAAEGVAVVLVEHDIQLVMGACTHIHVLDLGRVLASGPPATVQQDEAVLAAYLGAAP
ncbi:MAG: ABC transporter ATP-binding protein [Acidimicrobiales bacterium]